MKPKQRQSKAGDPAGAIAELRARLAEAEETIEAIRTGAVDALVVSGAQGEQVFALKGAETPYRLLVEAMHEAAVLINADGTILYCNDRLSAMAQCPVGYPMGKPLTDFVMPEQAAELKLLLRTLPPEGRAGEFRLRPGDPSGKGTPVQLAVRPLKLDGMAGMAVVATDLTTQKAYEAILHQSNQQLEERVRQRTADLTRANDQLRESEARFRGYFELGLIGMAITSPTKGIVQVNDELCRILGYERSELLRLSWAELTHPDDLGADVGQFNRVLAGEMDGYSLDKRWIRKDGQIMDGTMSVKCLRRADGSVDYFVALLQDITERKRAEQVLENTLQRFYLVLSSMYSGVLLMTEQGRVEFVNQAFCDAFGLKEGLADLVGLASRDLLAKILPAFQHPDQAKARVLQILERGQAVKAEEFAMQGGRTAFRDFIPLHVRGNRCGRLWIYTDITERKQAEEIVKRSKEDLERIVAERTAKLQEMVAELEHFSYTITHDMRAPLRAMQGFAEMMAEACGGCREQDAQRFLERVRTSAVRMDSLIVDALNYNRTIRQELPLEPVDVAALLRGMLDSYPELQSSKAQIELEGDFPLVMGNEAGLTQCFSNLLGNAVKFARPDQRPQIRIWAETRQPSPGDNRPISSLPGRPSTVNYQPLTTPVVRVWVEDNGIGISEFLLPRVFDMFTRGHNTYEGTGIGLALVRKVMDRMGGKAGVESEEGKGSRFWLDFRPAA